MTSHSGTKNRKTTGRTRATAKTAKSLLGFDSMLVSGAAYLGGGRWSVTLRISDVDYLVATQDMQLEILDKWGKFLNTFGGGQSLQVSIRTRTLDSAEVSAAVRQQPRGDGLDRWREDFNTIIGSKLSSMSKNSVVDKFVTVTITEHDPERAVLALNRLALAAEAQLGSLEGCRVHKLTRSERLKVLSDSLRPGEPFTFTEGRFASDKSTSTKDYVCPSRVDTRDPRRLRVESGGTEFYYQCLWVRDYPPVMGDQLVSELTDLKADVSVSVHLSPYDRADGLDVVKRKVAEMDMQIIHERRKNKKQHMPVDSLPADLEENYKEATGLRDDMEHSNEKLMDSIVVIGVAAPDTVLLDQRVKDVRAVLRRLSCTPETLGYMQVEGLNALLPLGANSLPMHRMLTTSGAAIMVPFTTQEVFEPGGVFYGTNAKSGNAVVVDREHKMNYNGFVLGTSGSGKSSESKWEIESRLMGSDDEVIIIDPEREFEVLRAGFGGAHVEVSAGSQNHINPMDIVFDDTGDGDPIKDKASTVMGMVSALVGGSDGLSGAEKSLVDRCLLALYREARNRPGSPMPTLADLRARLAGSGTEVGVKLALDLELYTTGSLSGFAQQTNVDIDNRLTVFDTHGLDGELQTFGMMVVLDQVWNRVVRNRSQGKRTWLYVDEFHLYFANPYAAAYFLKIYKRARKYGLGVTGITQNIEELLMDEQARLMLSNSDFLLLMNQTPSDADTLTDLMRLSAEQRALFTGVEPGQGVIRTGTAFIPFDGRIDTRSMLYRLNSTDFDEALNQGRTA